MTAKRHRPSATLPWLLLPAIIFAAGVALTLWLQSFTQNGSLFNTDGGLQALVTQQIAQQIKAGDFPLDVSLNLPAADWVTSVWASGLYPFSSAFVHAVGTERFVAAPFTFPLVSAPFYALLGDRGLYIIPLAALWLIWGRFWQIGLRAGWGIGSLCIGLVSLIFASPLTLHGGMFTSQTLVVALAFWGVSGLMFPKAVLRTRPQSLGCGILIGLAAWLGPEFLCLIVIVSFLALIGWLRPKWRLAPAFSADQVVILIGSMLCTAGVFFAINYAIYGNLLGGYARQIATISSITEQLGQASTDYAKMGQTLQQYFPVVWVVALAAIFSPELKQRSVRTSPFKNNALKEKKGLYFDRLGLRKTAASTLMPSRFALSLCLLFVLIVPLVLIPIETVKQWEPQAYLLLMPLLSLALAEQLRTGVFHRWGRRLLLVGVAIALIFGIQLNTINGAFGSYRQGGNASPQANYESVESAIAALQKDSHQLIATSSELITQQLWSALPSKTFFRAETIDQVKQLAGALVEQSKREFLYVCYPDRVCTVTEAGGNELNLEDGVHTLNLVYVDDYGQYPTYTVEIVEIVRQTATLSPQQNSNQESTS